MVVWNKWVRFKKRRNSRYDKISTAAPVNTTPPSITDGGNGLMLANRGTWDNYPTQFTLVWKVNGQLVQFGDSFNRPSNINPNTVSLEVTARNDNGQTTIIVP